MKIKNTSLLVVIEKYKFKAKLQLICQSSIHGRGGGGRRMGAEGGVHTPIYMTSCYILIRQRMMYLPSRYCFLTFEFW